MKELIDYFDEDRNYLGVVDKDEAHEKGLWHNAVHVWIVNDKNQILLQRRGLDKDFFPGTWDASIGGHIGAGDNSLNSAIREGEEELGIKIEPEQLEYLFTNKESTSYRNIKVNEFLDIYLMRTDIDINDIIIQKEELLDAKYVDIDEFLRMVETKDESLFPHVNEYEQLIKFL